MQFDWEQAIEKKDISHLNISYEHFYSLIDEYSKLVGSKKNISKEVFELKRIHKIISSYILNMTPDNEMEYDIAMLEYSEMSKEVEGSTDDVFTYISTAYSIPDKKTISVKDYLKLYKGILDGKVNI